MPWHTKENLDMKQEFIDEIKENAASMADICRRFGISRKTGYKWKARYEELGEKGLYDESRRPKNSIVVSESLICEVVKIRTRFGTWGARKIRAKLILQKWSQSPIPSVSSINRILKNCGLLRTKKARRSYIISPRIDESEEVVLPNDEWSIDFKGWWYSRDKKSRCMPLTIRDSRSRFVICVALTKDARTASVKAVMEKCFKKYGLPLAIRSDNGPPFASPTAVLGLSQLSAWWISLGIKIIRTRPGCPQDNGAHERMHRDMMDELERQGADTQKEMNAWKDRFNKERPHEALGGETPYMHYSASPRKYKEKPKEYVYGEGMQTRGICVAGDISYENVTYFISRALSKQRVGIKKVDDNYVKVFYCSYFLGTIDTKNGLWIPVQELKETDTPRVISGVPSD